MLHNNSWIHPLELSGWFKFQGTLKASVLVFYYFSRDISMIDYPCQYRLKVYLDRTNPLVSMFALQVHIIGECDMKWKGERWIILSCSGQLPSAKSSRSGAFYTRPRKRCAAFRSVWLFSGYGVPLKFSGDVCHWRSSFSWAVTGATFPSLPHICYCTLHYRI
jgi:hypothetical protein